MAFSKYLISALAVASSVHAQCSTKGTLTITNTAQATALASCQTYSGSIAIHTKYAGDLAIDGPRRITGNLVAHDADKMTSLSSSYLQTIEGMWSMVGVGALGSLTFGQLSSVKGIEWDNMGQALTQLDFATGITEIDSLAITGTYLTTLEGISPVEASSININANSFLQNVTMQLKKVKGNLIITGNIPAGSVITDDTETVSVSMPKLTHAGSIQINNASDISLPVLEYTTGSVAFSRNYVSQIALPQLTTAQGVIVASNPMLHSLSLPNFENSTGSFSITNNTKLTGTLSFPKLETIKGAPNFFGAFSGLSMPKLEHVNGGMNISSTKQIEGSVCRKFEGLGGRVISGPVHCKGAAPNTHTSPTEGSGYGGGSTNDDKPDAAGHIQTSVALVLGAAVTIATFML